MDEKQLEKIINEIEEWMVSRDIRKEFFHPDLRNPKRDHMLMHCHAMIEPMRKHLSEGKLEKVNRWIGFTQACFWQLGIMSLNSIRNTNSIFLN